MDEKQMQAVADAIGILYRNIIKTRFMCDLILQVAVNILENQYRVHEADRKQAESHCEELERAVERKISEIETMFKEEQTPKKSCFDEFIKKCEETNAKHVKENNIGE